jgi:hypothetical protein
VATTRYVFIAIEQALWLTVVQEASADDGDTVKSKKEKKKARSAPQV